MTIDYKAAVVKGAKFLDSVRPGWHDEVNIDNLKQIMPMNCVLGQVYGHYDDGLNELGISDSAGAHFGFTLAKDDHYNTSLWSDITVWWKDEVMGRRKGVVPADESRAHTVTAKQIEDAKQHIANAISQHDAYVADLTESGTLLHVLMALGIKVQVA